MSKVIIAIVMLSVAAVGECQSSRVFGSSDSFAQAVGTADLANFTVIANNASTPAQSTAQAVSIFDGVSASQLRGAALGSVDIDRFRSGRSNVPVLRLDGQAATEVAGVSNNNNGVASRGGSNIEAVATPNTAALQIASQVLLQQRNNGQVAAANAQEGNIRTADASAGFESQATAGDTGRNTQAFIQALGSSAVTQNAARSSSAVCVTLAGTQNCNLN